MLISKHTRDTRFDDSAAGNKEKSMAKEIREAPAHCMIRGCIMTMGFGIGGGAHICWLHRLAAPKVDKALTKCGAREVGLSPNFGKEKYESEIVTQDSEAYFG